MTPASELKRRFPPSVCAPALRTLYYRPRTYLVKAELFVINNFNHVFSRSTCAIAKVSLWVIVTW